MKKIVNESSKLNKNNGTGETKSHAPIIIAVGIVIIIVAFFLPVSYSRALQSGEKVYCYTTEMQDYLLPADATESGTGEVYVELTGNDAVRFFEIVKKYKYRRNLKSLLSSEAAEGQGDKWTFVVYSSKGERSEIVVFSQEGCYIDGHNYRVDNREMFSELKSLFEKNIIKNDDNGSSWGTAD